YHNERQCKRPRRRTESGVGAVWPDSSGHETMNLLLLVGQCQAQIVVVRAFGHTEPWHDAVAEGHVVVVNFLEAGVFIAEFFVDFVGGLERGIHDIARESLEHGAAAYQATQRSRIVGVVVADHSATGST